MYEKYIVQKEDTLESIANKFNTLTNTILDINNIAFDDYIRGGIEIIVPKSSENYFEYYKVNKGDSIYAIARKYNINPELIMAINGFEHDDYIYPEQTILIPKSGYSYYITKEGDTIDIVAQKFGITKDELNKQNDIIYLLDGQLLVNKTK